MNEPHEVSYNPAVPAVLPNAVPHVRDQAEECNSWTQTSETRPKFRHYFFVLNPASGSADVEKLQKYALEKASKLGKQVEFHILQPEDKLSEVLKKAARNGAEVFVAAGGDGTLAAVATEAHHQNKIFGVIPSGTANVFAAEHLIPKGIEDAVDLLLEDASLKPVDLLVVKNKAFLCHISIGTYALITTQTPQRAKKVFGRLAYLYNAVKLLFKKRIWTFELDVDGKKMKRRASTIMVTNVGSLGATGLRWGNNISSGDGLIEVSIIRARSLRHYLALLWAFIRRRPSHPLQEYAYVRERATIRGPKHLPVRADGEEIGKGQFEFRVEKHGLGVLMAPDARQNPN